MYKPKKILLALKRLTIVATVIIASTLFASFVPIYAMGQSPGACPNRYDDIIISMTVTSNYRHYNVILHQNAVIKAQKSSGYDVTFRLQTAGVSSDGNIQGGTAWYDSSGPGFEMGVCQSGATPLSNIRVTIHETYPSNFPPNNSPFTQHVAFGTWDNGNFQSGPSFTIDWVV